MLEIFDSLLSWRLIPVSEVGRLACQGFLVKEDCVGILVVELDLFSLECNEASSSEF